MESKKNFENSPPFFLFLAMAAILFGALEHRTHFWKGTTQGPFHQSLVQIHPVVSEEKIEMCKVYGRTDDGRQVMAIAHMDLWSRWAKKKLIVSEAYQNGHKNNLHKVMANILRVFFCMLHWSQLSEIYTLLKVLKLLWQNLINFILQINDKK